MGGGAGGRARTHVEEPGAWTEVLGATNASPGWNRHKDWCCRVQMPQGGGGVHMCICVCLCACARARLPRPRG